MDEWDATQHAILDATVECAAERGFGGVTTRRVAQIAGVNEVTVFRRFGTKTDLLAAAFRREATRISDDIGDYTGDIVTDLTRIVEALRNGNRRRQALVPQILAELAVNPELRGAAHEALQSVGRVVAIIERYQRDGEIAPGPPLLAYAALIGPIVILGLLEQLAPEVPPFDAAAAVRRFLDGSAPSADARRAAHSTERRTR